MKTYVVLKLLKPTDALIETLCRIEYSFPNDKGYVFKPFVTQYDVCALARFATANNMEAYICTATAAREIHGLPV